MAAESPAAATNRSASPLRATLEIEPATETACAVAADTPNAASVTRSFAEKDVCHGEVTVVDGDDYSREYVSEPRTNGCICATISRFDCAFDVDEIRRGSLVVSLVVADRGLLGRIVDALEETGASVRLCHLSHLSSDDDPTLEIEATNITEKQREAVELAVELGYYDRPRTATLSDLATELGVSKSAVSQRLTAVELTLVRSLVEQ